MVRVSSETVPAGKFYQRFFGLMDHYLATVPRSGPVATVAVTTKPLAPLPIVTPPAPTLSATQMALSGAASQALTPVTSRRGRRCKAALRDSTLNPRCFSEFQRTPVSAGNCV